MIDPGAAPAPMIRYRITGRKPKGKAVLLRTETPGAARCWLLERGISGPDDTRSIPRVTPRRCLMAFLKAGPFVEAEKL